METLKIVKGQPFVLWVPTIMLNADGKQAIDASTLTNVAVTAGNGCKKIDIGYQPFEHWLVLQFGGDLEVGPYNIRIDGKLESGREFSLALSKAVEIVNWDNDSNWDRFIVGDHVELTDAPFITGTFYTDAELEQLKAEWREKIAEAEQAKEEAEEAKEEFVQKALMLDNVAQQGNNENATLTDTQSAVEALAPVAQAAEAYNTGKTELAQNITAKGVQASATETLPELAEKVGAIAQTQTILEGGEIYAAQQFGDGALWNLYQVLADMKTRFMGTGDYAALIVCEYYKGYDSLQLQGADAYYTCDGDLYDYANPNHVWHDADNGKVNRWVAFLYRNEGARLDITNTAISPRSMYIGGHIGTIEYFVNGRLTDIVCGVEETDIVDNFLSKDYTQSWGFNTVLRGIKRIKSSKFNKGSGTIVLDGVNMDIGTYDDYNVVVSADELYINGIPGAISADVYDLVIKNCPSINRMLFVANSAKLNSISLVDTTYIYGDAVYPVYSYNLIDILVSEMNSSFNLSAWNPTKVLSDATKKAKMIDNIKNHILARVSDATGGTQLVFTVSTNMFNAISGEMITWNDEEMTLADAFLTKNWLLAGA